MKLIFKGHQERYVVEQGMLNLFPGEKPVYEPIGPEDDTWAVVALEEWDSRCAVEVELSYRGVSASHRLEAPLSGTDFQREGIRRRSMGQCFFLAAREVLGQTPPWGMLTGVRPVKLPTRAMAGGATPQQAKEELEERYYVSPVRAQLAVDCARASLAVDRELCPDQVSLYVGIPFCPTRCAYCSFVSADVGRTLKLVEPYLEGLLREVEETGALLRRLGLSIHSLYVGGGTPTTLSAQQLHRLLSAMETQLPLEHCVETTVEAGRPDTITREKLEALRGHGIRRISINPQTLEDHVLEAIGRRHSAREILDAYELARSVGFSSINMDLIAGLPRDSYEGFCRSLDGVLALKPENITVHTMALKKGSRLMEQGGSIPNGDEVAQMLERSLDILGGGGYEPYYLYRQKYMSGSLENVGWCTPGGASIYNIVMMEELQTVLSLGGGGVTKLVNRDRGSILRLQNPKYPQDYLSNLDKVLTQKEEIAAFYAP